MPAHTPKYEGIILLQTSTDEENTLPQTEEELDLLFAELAASGQRTNADPEYDCQRNDLICGVGNVQFVTVVPGHPFLTNGHDGTAIFGDPIVVGHEVAFDVPSQTFNGG